jgi:hypothetical protein
MTSELHFFCSGKNKNPVRWRLRQVRLIKVLLKGKKQLDEE